jgi:PDZ domain-containing protein
MMSSDEATLADPDSDPSSPATVGRPAAPGLETAEEARRSIRRWVLGMVLFVLGSAVVGGLLFKVPYVALVPGSARDTEPLLTIEGITEYPSEGELLYTTVRLRQRPNLWEYLLLRLDPDAEVVPEQNILGDRTPEENREFNLELMNNSKQVAVAVALEQLGYDAVRTDAVVIQALVAGEPADGVLEPGDSVLSIDGKPTLSTEDLVTILGEYEPGDEIELVVERFTTQETLTLFIVLGEHPDKPGGAFLGIQPADRLDFSGDFDFEVEIDSGSVGGPSAGLAFTLAVLDQLTEGELTGGSRVAVTGTVNAAGQVGPVGGVPQKTAAVRDLGVDVFIVPEGLGPDEIAILEDKAGDDLEIVAVSTVEEALAALDSLGGDVEAVDEFAAANRGDR